MYDISKAAIILVSLIFAGIIILYHKQPTLSEKQKAAIEFIKSEEGLILNAKQDSNGHWIIGYSTRSHKGERITKEEAQKRLESHLNSIWRYIPEELNKNQYIVYSSLVYNLGHNKARKLLTVKLDCDRLLKWDKVKGKSYRLTNRRQREYQLCVK